MDFNFKAGSFNLIANHPLCKMNILDVEQIKAWDAYTIQSNGISSFELMRQAAVACTDWILKQYEPQKVLLFCGTGNNGGDGLVIASFLQSLCFDVSVYVLQTGNRSADFTRALEQLRMEASFMENEKDFPVIPQDVLLIDALLGTGANRPPDALLSLLIQHINKNHARIISIDMPSGMYADAASVSHNVINARHTLSFECMKTAFLVTENLPRCGQVHLLSIGLSGDYIGQVTSNRFSIDEKLARQIFKPRPAWVHKYQMGHALIIAGSENMMGAALLSAKACMRTGAGLCTLKVPSHLKGLVHIAVPEVITTDSTNMYDLGSKKSVMAFGPGLLVNEENESLLAQILTNWSKPLLIDASGLSILKILQGLLRNRPEGLSILTPHVGEFERLFGPCENDFDRLQRVQQQAKELGCYIVLKGPHTVIATPQGQCYFNTSGNSGMATAGSGDVLTGIITGLLAQQYSPLEACVLGVYLHGLAGDCAADEQGKEALLAGDIIHHLGSAYKKLYA